jgi:hypothetical protein
MSLPTKEELGAKLLDYPLLRQLVFERWFRLAFACFILIFIFLALFLPKIWRTSTPEFRPVIKVSGLDLVQAWSLKRSALKAAAAGKFDEANYAWQAALANNRADPDLVRGALRNLLKSPHRREQSRQGVQEALWLLKLTGTNNLPDLELAAQTLAQFRYYDMIVQLLTPRLNAPTGRLAAVYLKALFDQGQVKLFDQRWAELSDKVHDDPELPLYRAAYLVGWGPPGTMTAARQQLEAAIQDPALRILAYRLKLTLNAREINASDFGQTLKKLEDLREDTLNYHIEYWRLLAATGQKTQAVRLAQEYPHLPNSALEVVELAQAYSELELHDTALALLQRYAKEFGQVPVFWISYANVLVELKRWEDLRNLALQIRSEAGVRDQLGGFSYFLEGRAELSLGRNVDALTAFRKAAEGDFPFPTLGQRVASQLLQYGHPDLARQILTPLEKPLQAEPTYWLLAFSAADQLKDVDLLLRAATRAYELIPNDLRAMNNYAAALIINRQNPQKAIQLTLQLYSENPTLLYAVVNHSAALLLNDRPKEAEALLDRVSTNTLTRSQLALFNLDLFETYYSLRNYDRAWVISDQIEADRLYPTQRRWLEKARQQLPPREKSG